VKLRDAQEVFDQLVRAGIGPRLELMGAPGRGGEEYEVSFRTEGLELEGLKKLVQIAESRPVLLRFDGHGRVQLL
jgi:hypothetical protein